MEYKKYIYDNGTDAFSYAVILLVSTVVPTIISWLTDEPLYLMVSMFINSIGLIKENLLLLKFKKVIKRFWIERAVGIFSSVIIATYSIIALSCWLGDVGQDKIPNYNIAFSLLFFVPVVISGFEGIIYAMEDFKENVISDNLVIAQSTAVDV